MPNESAEAAAGTKSPASACVLVAGEDADDVKQLVEHLRQHFQRVESSMNADTAAAEFDQHAPDVVVVAFKTLEHAERYYLALHRFSESMPRRPHRTVLLCRKEDTAAAFELCKKWYFDDYVLYWPNPQDGLRIPMSVWLAARELLAKRKAGPSAPELHTHANHLEELDRKITQQVAAGEQQAAAAEHSLVELERDLSEEHDRFSRRLASNAASGAIEIKDPAALDAEFARFKAQQLERARLAREAGLKPMSAWARGLKNTLEPALTETRATAARMRQVRPIVLVVDDDDTMRSMLKSVLNTLGFEPILASTGHQALRELAHVRPDVILMDIRLTDSDGVTLTRQLKASRELLHVPVLLMSGDSRRDTLVSSIEAGAIDFITKPFRLEVLRTKLEKALRHAAAV